MDLRSKEPVNQTKNSSVIRNVIVTLLIIAFFLSVIFIYYGMLYRETRDGIIKNGELLYTGTLDELKATHKSQASLENIFLELTDTKEQQEELS